MCNNMTNLYWLNYIHKHYQDIKLLLIKHCYKTTNETLFFFLLYSFKSFPKQFISIKDELLIVIFKIQDM